MAYRKNEHCDVHIDSFVADKDKKGSSAQLKSLNLQVD